MPARKRGRGRERKHKTKLSPRSLLPKGKEGKEQREEARAAATPGQQTADTTGQTRAYSFVGTGTAPGTAAPRHAQPAAHTFANGAGSHTARASTAANDRNGLDRPNGPRARTGLAAQRVSAAQVLLAASPPLIPPSGTKRRRHNHALQNHLWSHPASATQTATTSRGMASGAIAWYDGGKRAARDA